MKIKDYYKIILGILIPTIILISLISRPVITLAFGDEILLETQPVDPIDLFRGHYVVLNYKISTVSTENVENFNENLFGKDVFVVLEKENAFYNVDYVTNIKPKDKIYIKGKLTGYDFRALSSDEKKVNIDYNINRYYVQENTGKELEELSRKGQLIARLKVRNGYGLVTKIFGK